MKKIIALIIIMILVITSFGCKPKTTKEDLARYCEEDSIYEMSVSQKRDNYLVSGKYFVEYELFDFEITLTRDEVRDVIINKLNGFSEFYVNMSDECAISLGLKKENKGMGDLFGYTDFNQTWSKYANIISFHCIERDMNNKYGDVVKIIVNDYFSRYKKDIFESLMQNQDEKNGKAVLFIENRSSRIQSNNDFIYVSFDSKVGHLSGNDYLLTDYEKRLLTFKGDVIDYDNMTEEEIKLFEEFVDEFVNLTTSKKPRKILKGFNKKTTYKEFVFAAKLFATLYESKAYVDIDV